MSETILIGKIVGAFGIGGELKLYNYAESQKRYEQLKQVIINGTPYEIQGVRTQKNVILLRLRGIEDRNGAEALRGKNVYMDAAELPKLPEKEHYIRDIIGFDVLDESSGKIIGQLKEVLTERAQPVYVVAMKEGKDVLIPGVPVFVKKIDEEQRRITVALIEGMLP